MDDEKALLSWKDFFFVLLVVAVAIFAWYELLPHLKGTLAGHVTVGPLCPVEPCNVPPERVAQACEARAVIVYSWHKIIVIEEIPINATCEYSTSLKPGYYTVDLKKNGIDRSPDVPRTVLIEPGKTVVADINIDTGIR